MQNFVLSMKRRRRRLLKVSKLSKKFTLFDKLYTASFPILQ